MYDTTIAAKLLKQLESFLGRISPHFHKPAARFIGDMMYGIMAEKDVKLSSIVRALKEGITPKKVEDRLSRMLSSNGLERDLHDVIAAEGARKVHRDESIKAGGLKARPPPRQWFPYMTLYVALPLIVVTRTAPVSLGLSRKSSQAVSIPSA